MSNPKKRGTPKDALVGARIRAARRNAGMSLTEVGKITGIGYQQIAKYEHGINRVGPDRLQRIAAATKHPITFFFEDIEVKTEGRPEVTTVVKLMGSSLPVRRIIQALPGLISLDA